MTYLKNVQHFCHLSKQKHTVVSSSQALKQNIQRLELPRILKWASSPFGYSFIDEQKLRIMHSKRQIMRTATSRWHIILNYVKKIKIKCKREAFALNSVLHIQAYILISINLIKILKKVTSTVRQFISNSIRDSYTC